MNHTLLLCQKKFGRLLCLLVATACLWSCEEEAPVNQAPWVEIGSVMDITRTTAVLSGYVYGSSPSSSVGDYYFLYSTSRNDLNLNVETTEDGAEGGAKRVEVRQVGEDLTATLNGLQGGVTYHYRLVAQSGHTKVASDIGSFTTLTTSAPELGDVNTMEIGETQVKLSCNVWDNGGSDIVFKTFQYKTETESEYTFAAPVSGYDDEETGEYSLLITGLQPNTHYIFRAVAINQSGLGYSYEREERTNPLSVQVTTQRENYNVTGTSITVGGSIGMVGSDEYDIVITECGICWGTGNATPNVYDDPTKVIKSDTEITETNRTFSVTINGLQPNSRYYVRAYAKSRMTIDGTTTETVAYGEVEQINTSTLMAPQFDYLQSDNVTYNSAKLSAVITSTGDGTIIEKGFCWSTGYSPTIDNNYQKVEGDELTTVITGLTAQTEYYFRAYIIYEVNGTRYTAYSDSAYFWTGSVQEPQFSNFNHTDITQHTATLTITVSGGDGNIVERGFCWNTGGSNPTIDDNRLKVDSSEETITATLTGLKSYTNYYVCGYAIYELDGTRYTAYSQRGGFRTVSISAPSINLNRINDVTDSSALFSASIRSMGDGETITEKGFCWSTESDPTLGNGKTSHAAVTGDNFTYRAEGLTSGTTYYVRAYAKTVWDGEEVTGYSSYSTFTVKTIPGNDGNTSPDTPKQ